MTIPGHDRPHPEEDWVDFLGFSPDSRWLVTVGKRNQIFDLSAQGPGAGSLSKPINLLTPGYSRTEDRYSTSARFSPDHRWLVVSGLESFGPLFVWGLRSASSDLNPHLSLPGVGVLYTDFTSDSSHLVGLGFEGVSVWDLDSQDPSESVTKTPLADQGRTRSIRLSAAGLLRGTDRNTLEIWDLSTHDLGQPLRLSGVRSHAVSRNGRWLVTSGDNTELRLWGLGANGSGVRQADTLRGYDGAVGSLAVGDDARWVAVASPSGAAWVWDRQAEQPTAYPMDLGIPEDRLSDQPSLSRAGAYSRLDFTPDSRGLVFQRQNLILLFNLSTSELMNLAPPAAGRNLSKEEWKRYNPGADYAPTYPDLPIPDSEAATRTEP
jgi:WD40 repeat protein